MRPCLWRGCPELVERGYCPPHQRLRDGEHNAAPHRFVYRHHRWRGPRGARRRALVRAGFQCEVVEDGVRCQVIDRTGRRLDAHHTVGVRELLARGLDPFDLRWVRVACASHHARIEALLRSRAAD